MPRKKFVCGNFKMNLTGDEVASIATSLKAQYAHESKVTIGICPAFVNAYRAREVLKGTGIMVGAQDVSEFPGGAHTGCVSASMLLSEGFSLAIVGHSERRQMVETDEIINKKVLASTSSGLTTILCVGETLKEREAGLVKQVIKRELDQGLKDLEEEALMRVVIAYEPIWAIGTGRSASSKDAEEVHAFIRQTIAELFSQESAKKVTILYGGSVKGSNAPELFRCPNIDGALVGGASLKWETFEPIIKAAVEG